MKELLFSRNGIERLNLEFKQIFVRDSLTPACPLNLYPTNWKTPLICIWELASLLWNWVTVVVPVEKLYLRDEYFKEDIDQASISQQPVDKIRA